MTSTKIGMSQQEERLVFTTKVPTPDTGWSTDTLTVELILDHDHGTFSIHPGGKDARFTFFDQKPDGRTDAIIGLMGAAADHARQVLRKC